MASIDHPTLSSTLRVTKVNIGLRQRVAVHCAVLNQTG